MSNLNFPCCCLNSQLLFLHTADTGQNIAFLDFATKTSSYIHPNAIQPALTTVLCRPLVTLTGSLLHPLEIVSFSFLLKDMEHKVNYFISSSPFLQGQQKEDPCRANYTFLLNLPLWSLGVFHACHWTWNLESRLTTLVLPSLTKLSAIISSQAGPCLSPPASWFPAKNHWAILIFPAGPRHQE